MGSRLSAWLLFAAAPLLSLAACGGDGGPGAPESSARPAAAGSSLGAAAITSVSDVQPPSAAASAISTQAPAVMLPDPSPASSAELEACFELDASTPGEFPEAEVYLLPDGGPVELEAVLRDVAPIPDSMRVVRREVVWTADDAVLKSDAGAPGRAVLTPPDDSRLIRVRAEGRITVEPGSIVVRKTLDFLFLSPLPNAAMQKGIIAGYEVGEYPPVPPTDPKAEKWPRIHTDRYQPPSHFWRVGKDEKPLKLSCHLTLGHFVIDYPWGTLGMPQYLAIDYNLIHKLEDLIDLINQDGRFKCTGLTPIYGFRPPAFNRRTIEDANALNLKVPYSMHQYGRALDFIIDEDGDLVMDDLNGDGRHDLYDAAEVMHYVNILDRRYRSEGRREMVGGAGIYEFHDFAGRVRTPYIHVDTRGFTSEDGSLIRWKEPAPSRWPDGSPIQWGKI